MPYDPWDWVSVLIASSVAVGGLLVFIFALAGWHPSFLEGLYENSQWVIAVLTALVAATTTLYAREARIARHIDRWIRDIRENYSPLITIVEDQIMKPHLDYAVPEAPDLRKKKSIEEWRILPGHRERYDAVVTGSKEQKELKEAAELGIAEKLLSAMREKGLDESGLTCLQTALGNNLASSLAEGQDPPESSVANCHSVVQLMKDKWPNKHWQESFSEVCGEARQASQEYEHYISSRRQFLEEVWELLERLYESRAKTARHVMTVRKHPPQDLRPPND